LKIFIHLEQCPYLNCSKIDPSICNPSIECLSESNLLCASNLEEYSNECQMNKYACQLNIRLTKLHDGPCDVHEQQQKMEGRFSEEIFFFFSFVPSAFPYQQSIFIMIV